MLQPMLQHLPELHRLGVSLEPVWARKRERAPELMRGAKPTDVGAGA